MQTLKRVLCHLSISPIRGSVRTYVIGNGRITSNCTKLVANRCNSRLFSMDSQGGDGEDFWNKAWKGSKPSESQSDPGWDSVSSWSTGLTKEHFDGTNEEGKVELPDRVSKTMVPRCDDDSELEKAIKESRSFVDNWDRRFKETCALLQQVREPGVRGSYLKDSEKAEMYRLHKSDPETYNVERLAKDYRIMRQRVHAILWLKEMEEEEKKKLGHKLDDSIEVLLDTCPEFFNSHDREFHVASLPYKPDFKVMPEGWDGTTRDPDEVHYEISMKEDEILYQEFVERLNFNKKKVAGEVKMKRYSRRRPSEGWSFTVEKLGPHGKRGGGGGWKFVSLPDGSSRALNEIEKMYVRRETPRRRRKIFS